MGATLRGGARRAGGSSESRVPGPSFFSLSSLSPEWQSNVISDPSKFRSARLAAILGGVDTAAAITGGVPSHAEESAAQAAVAQALWGVAEGSREDILNGSVLPGGWRCSEKRGRELESTPSGLAAAAGSAASEVRPLSDTSNLEHLPEAFAAMDAALEGPRLLPTHISARNLPPWLHNLNMRLCTPDTDVSVTTIVDFGTSDLAGGKAAAPRVAQLIPTASRSKGGASRAIPGTDVDYRTRSSARRVVSLSLGAGPIVLLEHLDETLPVAPKLGMASRIVTFLRASSDEETIALREAATARARAFHRGDDRVGGAAAAIDAQGGRAEADDDDEASVASGDGRNDNGEGGVLSSSSVATRKATPKLPEYVNVADGQLEIVAPRDPVPFIGGLDPGEALTVMSSPLFIAPLLEKEGGAHSADGEGAQDFLLVFCPASGARPARAVLRPVLAGEGGVRAYVMGQAQPRLEVMSPPLPRSSARAASSAGESSSQSFLSALACLRLRALFSRTDNAFEARALREGQIPASARGRLAPGIVSLRRALKDFGIADIDDASYAALVSTIADADIPRGILRRKATTSSAAPATRSPAITPEAFASFDSMRAGVETLRQLGAGSLRFDDKTLDEALRALQSLHHSVSERLRARPGDATSALAASAGGGAKAATGVDPKETWESDGVYRRLCRTISIAQALHYAIALAPWATTRNTLTFVAALPSVAPHFSTALARRGTVAAAAIDDAPVVDIERSDLSAAVLADANGVGDISGRGECFSLIRDMSNRGLNAERTRSLLAAAVATPFGGRKEGTEYDARGLTKFQLAQKLLDYGVPAARIQKMNRWARWAELKSIDTAALIALQKTGKSGTASSAMLFAGEVKMSSRERKRTKILQAKEILRRQCDALAERPWLSSIDPAHKVDEGELSDEDDKGFEAELEKQYGAGRSVAAAVSAVRADPKAAVDEAAEFAALRDAYRSGALFKSAPARQGAPIEDPLTASRRRFPGIPPELFQAPLVALVAGAAHTPRHKVGARKPLPLSALNESGRPELIGAFAPAWVDSAAGGAPVAHGKDLRTVRTTVDATGAQRVVVTYTVSRYAVASAWLRSEHDLSLGALGPPRKLELTKPGQALLSAGYFTPIAERPARAAAAAAREKYRSLFDTVIAPFFTPRAAAKHSRDEGTPLRRINFHGATVIVCPTCRVWGHRVGACPIAKGKASSAKDPSKPGRGRARIDVSSEAASERIVAVEQAKALEALLAGDGQVAAGATPAAASGAKRGATEAVDDNAVGRRWRAGGARAVDPRAVSFTGAAWVTASPDADAAAALYKDDSYANRFSHLRDFAARIDGQLAKLTALGLYDELMVIRSVAPVSPRALDIMTLRTRIIERRYSGWREIEEALADFGATAVAAFGATSYAARLAKDLIREMREWGRREEVALRRLEAGAVQTVMRYVRPRLTTFLAEATKAPPSPLMDVDADEIEEIAAGELRDDVRGNA
jgi:hypothetical protein